MGEKIGAGGKNQTYNEKNGWYGSGASSGKSSSGSGKVVAPVGEERGCVYVDKDGTRQFVPDGEKPKGHGSDADNGSAGESAPKLSKQEYATLRAEVMRKNAAQKGKVKPVGQAFTANYFYIYSTKGDDDFTVMMQLDIEADRAEIDEILKGGKKIT